MSKRLLAVAALLLSSSQIALSGDIEGTVVVKRKLTSRNIASAVDLYQRGALMAVRPEATADTLRFERSHVAIYLETADTPKHLTDEMPQQNRRFAPDMLVIPVGSTVSFPNLDPIFHNVFSLSKPKSFDLGNYPRNQTRTVTFSKSGLVFVNCHLHTNMMAVIVVAPNEWCARANEQGDFRLTNVPAGTYTVVAWHKTAGFFRQSVSVTSQGSSRIQFFIPLEPETEK